MSPDALPGRRTSSGHETRLVITLYHGSYSNRYSSYACFPACGQTIRLFNVHLTAMRIVHRQPSVGLPI